MSRGGGAGGCARQSACDDEAVGGSEGRPNATTSNGVLIWLVPPDGAVDKSSSDWPVRTVVQIFPRTP
jgi:hypothetical protein